MATSFDFHMTLSPTTASDEHERTGRRAGSDVRATGIREQPLFTDLAAATDGDPSAAPAPATESSTAAAEVDPRSDAGAASHTPARDAYLKAREQAGAAGAVLADPRMRRALILNRLRQEQARGEALLPDGYDANRKPPVWRARARSEWERHQGMARALDLNAEWQEQIRAELGPDSDSLARHALALVDARERILAQTTERHRSAIEEELAREPEWLTETLGPRPEHGAGAWQSLAAQLAANRMRFLITDDADPGIGPEQTHLTRQVALFQTGLGLAPSVKLTPDVGLGM